MKEEKEETLISCLESINVNISSIADYFSLKRKTDNRQTDVLEEINENMGNINCTLIDLKSEISSMADVLTRTNEILTSIYDYGIG